MPSRPTKKPRSAKQKIKKRYAKAREDAQLSGLIDTNPEGAIRNEVVDPKTQGSQTLPALIGQAIRNGWATPEHKKPVLVDELIGIVENGEADPHVRVAAVRVLQQGDKDQWERDNPELSGKSKGGVKVEVNSQVDVWNTLLQGGVTNDAVAERLKAEEQGAADAKHDEGRESNQGNQDVGKLADRRDDTSGGQGSP